MLCIVVRLVMRRSLNNVMSKRALFNISSSYCVTHITGRLNGMMNCNEVMYSVIEFNKRQENEVKIFFM